MTVVVDSQPVNVLNMWCIDMCCVISSISCLEKKTPFGTHEHTCYVDFNVCQKSSVFFPSTMSVSLEFR